jgi:dTDP-4-dehydrorhamnose reductase
MKVLVFGAGGMIGSAMFHGLSEQPDLQVVGTIRSDVTRKFFSDQEAASLITVSDVEKSDQLIRVFGQERPDVVINCIGLTKHHKEAEDPLLAIPLNALLPHRIAELCQVVGARLVHVSTDCVFAGSRGNYLETDAPDATDIYGKSKILGEVINSTHAITLRTSTIGHELNSAYGLLEWFLAQKTSCKGFSRAIFSGLPNTVFAQIVRDYVIPHPELHGLYHVAADPINKYDLLQLVARQYNKSIDITREDNFIIDRSLNADRFAQATGYRAAPWNELIRAMHATR